MKTGIFASALMLLSPAVRAESPADYSETLGQWDIEGLVVGQGNTISCKMQKPDTDGSPFMALFTLTAGMNGIKMIDSYISLTELPNSAPEVEIAFDGKTAVKMTGVVERWFLNADLATLDAAAKNRTVKLFQNSVAMTETIRLKGYPTQVFTVDLANSASAFDRGSSA